MHDAFFIESASEMLDHGRLVDAGDEDFVVVVVSQQGMGGSDPRHERLCGSAQLFYAVVLPGS